MTPGQKALFLEQSRAHHAADMLRKGTYGESSNAIFKGCSVGCHLHHILPTADAAEIKGIGDKHALVAAYYGYPEWLAHFQDVLFESLPDGDNRRWHVQLAETLHALREPYDWEAAFHRVGIALLQIAHKSTRSSGKHIKEVLELRERAAHGEDISHVSWQTRFVAGLSPEAGAAATSRLALWAMSELIGRDAGVHARAHARACQKVRDCVLEALADSQGAEQ